jgi:hypothetical protein
MVSLEIRKRLRDIRSQEQSTLAGRQDEVISKLREEMVRIRPYGREILAKLPANRFMRTSEEENAVLLDDAKFEAAVKNALKTFGLEIKADHKARQKTLLKKLLSEIADDNKPDYNGTDFCLVGREKL